MLNIASNDLKTLVLIKLTKSLIENSEAYAMFKLEKMLSSEKIESYLEKKKKAEKLRIEEAKQIKEIKKEKIKEKVKEKLNYIPSIMNSRDLSQSFFIPPTKEKEIFRLMTNTQSKQPSRHPVPIEPESMSEKKMSNIRLLQNRGIQHGMRISGDNLPEHLRYLRPTRTESPKELELGKLVPFLKDGNVKSIEVEGPDQVVYVKGIMGKKPIDIKLTKEEIDQILETFSKVGKVPKVEGLFKVAISNLILTAIVSESIGSRFIIKKM